jgi:phage/plasmid-like protein (TIGR03299 family)
MAHDIDHSKGRAAFARAHGSKAAWHRLGTEVNPDASRDDWLRDAGLDFHFAKGELLMRDAAGNMHDAKSLNRSIIYRDDTMEMLSVMSTDSFNIVQPDEIFDFIFDVAESMGWSVETAGALNGGRKFWALARIPEALAEIGRGDELRGFLLAASAIDGTLANTFQITSERVVCENTLNAAVTERGSRPRVKVYHQAKLDVAAVKEQLGLAQSTWTQFIESAKRLAAIKVSDKTAVKLLRKVYPVKDEKDFEGQGVRIEDDEFFYYQPSALKVLELFQGDGIGSNLASAKGTAWGLVNAVTELYDHRVRAKSDDNRLNSAWFGPGAAKKDAMFAACIELDATAGA